MISFSIAGYKSTSRFDVGYERGRRTCAEGQQRADSGIQRVEHDDVLQLLGEVVERLRLIAVRQRLAGMLSHTCSRAPHVQQKELPMTTTGLGCAHVYMMSVGACVLSPDQRGTGGQGRPRTSSVFSPRKCGLNGWYYILIFLFQIQIYINLENSHFTTILFKENSFVFAEF